MKQNNIKQNNIKQYKMMLIGPMYPYKGGIAHHNTVLYNELSKRHKVDYISFRSLYNKLLIRLFYKTNIDFRDNASSVKPELSQKEIIDSLNPLTWISAALKIKKMNPDLLIFQWLTPYFSPAYFSIIFLSKLFSKTKALFICHNVLPHESRIVDRMLTRLAFSQVDHYLIHSGKDLCNLKEIIKKPDFRLGFLPTPSDLKFADKSGSITKKKLGLRKKVILFFGYVRDYKGLKYLLKAMPIVLKRLNCDLLIVGEFWNDKQEYINLIKELHIEDHVKIVAQYVPDDEIGQYFKMCDVVALPYTSATQSAIVQVAFRFEKPVITTDVGGLKDAVKDDVTGSVIQPRDPDSFADAIIQFFDKRKGKRFIKNIKSERKRFSWDAYVNIIDNIVKRICS